LPEAASAWRIAGATLLVLMGALSSADSLICWSSVAISLARNRCVGSASHASSGFALPPLGTQSVCSPWPPFSGMLALESARLRSCVGAGCMGCIDEAEIGVAIEKVLGDCRVGAGRHFGDEGVQVGLR
jgi:hypothetical protein